MGLLRSWVAVSFGLVLGSASLLVAREYLRPATWRRPGLSLAEPPGPPVPPEGPSLMLGRVALGLGVAGFLLALVAGLSLWLGAK